MPDSLPQGASSLGWVKRLLVWEFDGLDGQIFSIPAFEWLLSPHKDTSLCAARITLFTQGRFEVFFVKNPYESFVHYDAEIILQWVASHGLDTPPSLHEAMNILREFFQRLQGRIVSDEVAVNWLKSQWAKLADEALYDKNSGRPAHHKNVDTQPASSAGSQAARESLNNLLKDIDCDTTKPASQ